MVWQPSSCHSAATLGSCSGEAHSPNCSPAGDAGRKRSRQLQLFTLAPAAFPHTQHTLQSAAAGFSTLSHTSSCCGLCHACSDDDLYITSSKLVVLETTNHILNFTILQVCGFTQFPV